MLGWPLCPLTSVFCREVHADPSIWGGSTALATIGPMAGPDVSGHLLCVGKEEKQGEKERAEREKEEERQTS